jgi:hypothetical protein
MVSIMPAHGGQHKRKTIQRVKRALFVFLHVFGIGQREAFHDNHQAAQGADNAADFGAH